MLSVTKLSPFVKGISQREQENTMDGKLTYVYLPVTDLKAARTFYRDTLGLDETWREGEATCAFALPGTTIQLMLNQVAPDAPDQMGMVFTIPSVDNFYQAQQAALSFIEEPHDIPGNGRWVGARDVAGHGLYFADIE